MKSFLKLLIALLKIALCVIGVSHFIRGNPELGCLYNIWSLVLKYED